MRVTLSKSAASWLRREMQYLKHHNPAAANRFVATMAQARQLLAEFPEIGPKGVHLPVRGARTWVMGDYLLDYTLTATTLTIVTIRHGRMKQPGLALDPDDD
jgi:plasmid stabilization system protein ParE